MDEALDECLLESSGGKGGRQGSIDNNGNGAAGVLSKEGAGAAIQLYE